MGPLGPVCWQGSLPHLGAGRALGLARAGAPAAIIENGTLPEQRVIVTSLKHLPEAAAEAAVESPVTIVIGEVVSLRDRLLRADHDGQVVASTS